VGVGPLQIGLLEGDCSSSGVRESYNMLARLKKQG
jgi:hypothetical protein